VTAVPPLLVGAVHETREEPLRFDDAETPVGAFGTVAGTATAELLDEADVPAEFVAVTLNVYEVPFMRPVTVHGFDKPQAKAACETVPTNGVTVKPVIAAPLVA